MFKNMATPNSIISFIVTNGKKLLLWMNILLWFNEPAPISNIVSKSCFYNLFNILEPLTFSESNFPKYPHIRFYST